MPVSNFGITVLGIKMYGGHSWGEVINIQLWSFFVVFLANWGNKEFLLRKFSTSPSSISGLFSSFFVTRTWLLLACLPFFYFFSLQVAVLMVLFTALLHVYNSLESLTIYFQKFSVHVWAEITAFVVVVILFLMVPEFNLNHVLLILCSSLGVKILFLAAAHRDTLIDFSIATRFELLPVAFPFFLIVMAGWLQSRIDVYLVNYYLDNSELANYRVISNSIILLQSISAFALFPFVKHLYRSKSLVVKKMELVLFVLGIPIVFFGMLGTYFLANFYLQVELSNTVYMLAFLTALPTFFYVVDIYKLYKEKLEKTILWINVAAILVNFSISIFLIKQHGISGALTGTFISQWLILLLVKWRIKHNTPPL